MEAKMIKIRIDGNDYEVAPGRNLLHTCLALGFDIPYFCFHPAMGSVGACRQCAVKKFANPDDRKGKIVMSCMEPVTDGLIISTNDPDIKAFRAAIIESLMTNHPHDCPICDEGGECHLQDMTVMTGHDYRRFNFKKRTYRNQYLGPFIHHEMNRCIQCYRCLRFYRDYAGGKDFNVYGSANRIYFGRHTEGVLENEFSGNLAEVCPTGVFTDKTLREHFTRKWDLTNSPSICIHCSLGCNTIVSERYGSVRRILSRYNGAVNGYFLCDRGRFGYEFVNSPQRVKNIYLRTPGKESQQVISNENFLSTIKPLLTGKKIIGIGSPRASLESNFALETLAGKENFYHGVSKEHFRLTKEAIHILQNTPSHSPSMKEIETADAILILGEDLTNSSPMLALAVRQACRNKSMELAAQTGIPQWNDAPVRELAQKSLSPLYIASPFSTKLDELAEVNINAAPPDIARLGFKIASGIDPSAPSPAHLENSSEDTATNIADVLKNAECPAIITGLHSNESSVLQAASNIALALFEAGRKPFLTIVFPESNSAGLGLLDGKTLDDLAEKPEPEEPETLVILENNLYSRTTKEKVEAIFKKFEKIIVLDYFMNETAQKADLILPAGTFAESTGTIINNEGRAQRYYRALPDEGYIKDSWKYLSEFIKIKAGKKELEWNNYDDIVESITVSYPVLAKVKDYIPDSSYRFLNEKISRQTARFSGRTAILANISVSEPGPPEDPDSSLAFSMEGYKGIPPVPYLVPYYWSPGWNSVQAMNKYMDEPDGSNLGGNQGVFLFDEKKKIQSGYYKGIPDPFIPENDKLLIIPVYLIFGSEELSSTSKPVARLIPEPFIILNEKEKNNLRITENDYCNIIIGQINIKLRVRFDNSLPDGLAGLSIMAGRLPFTELPGWGKVEPAAIE